MRTTTTGGTVEGRQLDGGLLQFRGVPFAASAEGLNRFRPPQPVEPWGGVRDARDHGPIAPQAPSMLESMLGGKERPMSEDCLRLTVTTPSLDGARPVMVWIHGGGFQTGAPSIPWYDGRQLAAHGDVVVVAVGYRLGAFGWLRLDHLLGGDYAASANLGLLDQVAALEWVRDNIAAFGGDSEQVTIFGESAGGMSVATLMGTPAAAGLFGRAVAQSGACGNVATPDEASAVTAAVLRHLGGDERGPELLLEVSTEQLLSAQEQAAGDIVTAPDSRLRLPFSPVHDGVVLPDHPLEAIRAGSSRAVSLLAGTTADEWTLFHLQAMASGPLDDERLARRARRAFGVRASEAIDTYWHHRPDASADELWVAMATDLVFRMPAVRLAEAQLAHQADIWAYRFAYCSTAFGGGLKACHGIEIPFVFDNLDRGGVEALIGELDDDTRRLGAVTSGAWLAFARHGDPGHEGLPAWPRYDTERRAVMELGPTCELLDDPDSDQRRLFEGIV